MSTLITLVIFYILIITAGAINASLLSSIIMLTMFTLISFFLTGEYMILIIKLG